MVPRKYISMINAKEGILSDRLWFWLGAIVILAGCSSPLNRKMQLSDLQDPNPSVRVMAIKWAGDNKVSSAVPQLVDFLQDEDRAVRFYAIEALRRITGTDNGYDYKANPERRAEAVKRWREYIKAKGL